MKQVPLPPADQVDVKAELAALRAGACRTAEACQIARELDRAIEDAVDETAKPEPDKEEVGQALERVGQMMLKRQAISPRTPQSCCLP